MPPLFLCLSTTYCINKEVHMFEIIITFNCGRRHKLSSKYYSHCNAVRRLNYFKQYIGSKIKDQIKYIDIKYNHQCTN